MFKHPTNRRAVLSGAIATAAAGAVVGTAHAGRQKSAGSHIVLLGDSVLDNSAYVGAGPDVVQQVRRALPTGARATLAAIDGTVTGGVRRQLQGLPSDATHLVVSAGGNDALHYSNVLEEKAGSVSAALDKLASVREQFMVEYGAMLDAVVAYGLPVACCTIYDPRFPDERQRRLASAGLTIFNDCITRAASACGIALIDLRIICSNPEDLANPIEPSAIGGAKIARAITEFAAEYDRTRGRSEVFAHATATI